MLRTSLKPGHLFQIVPKSSPMWETTCFMTVYQVERWAICDQDQTSAARVGLWHHYLELLVRGAATRAARALDPDGRLAFGVTHIQERREHAPPKHTHACTQIAASWTGLVKPRVKSNRSLNFTCSCHDCTTKLIVIRSSVSEETQYGMPGHSKLETNFTSFRLYVELFLLFFFFFF